MNRSEYKKIATRVEAPGVEPVEGELRAGKPNGATKLDIGGEADVTIKEAYDGETVTIHFITEDRTRGELKLNREDLAEALSDSV
jgi:hypothetical protein